MRRSQAPSMRLAAKRGTISSVVQNVDCINSYVEPEEMQWGTTGGSYTNKGPRRYGDEENPLRNKRIFLVLWRQQSNKKHKTWTGNGTLEVTATQATLKNELGKTLDVLTCFKHEKIHEEALLEIGMRDVEIQHELKTKAECVAQRKEEIENWYQQQDESNGIVSYGQNNVPKRSKHRSIHPLKKPKHSLDDEADPTLGKVSIITPRVIGTATARDNDITTPPDSTRNPISLKEYICMLTPADLQLQTLQLLGDNSSASSEKIIEITQTICDHPALLKDLMPDQLVSEVLLPHLPPWEEMGLYDSAKLEFVHQMLDNWVVNLGNKCAVVASTQQCLDIIKAYCRYWEIPHQQLDETSSSSDIPEGAMVILLLASKLPLIRLTNCKYLILYNYSARSAGISILKGDCDTQIYTLITAGCLEELQFQQHLGLVQGGDNLQGLLQVRATHELLLEHRENILASFSQWQSPFSEAFLQEAFKTEELSVLSFVFSNEQDY